MMAWLIVLWEAASGILRTTVIESVDFAASGSHVSTPVSMPDFVGQTYGSGTGDNIGRTQYINAIGRSGGGRRVRVAFFGTNVNDETFRFNAGENAQVDAIITALEGNSVDLVAIDGIEPIWKSYMNAGFNAHWQRAARS
jgi:hypothetical protein